MNCVIWIFGRGASVACNLRWTVPNDWIRDNRSLQVEQIREAVIGEMNRPEVDTAPYRQLLEDLARRTKPGWQHCFYTTNWDYLLQKEIFGLQLKAAPSWMTETHVFHLNGTVEPHQSTTIPGLRSPFLLESDNINQRTRSLEFDRALQFMVWKRHFIVVGLSFSCPTDRALLAILHRVEDDLLIGASWWHLVDPSRNTVLYVADRIRAAFPRAYISASYLSL